MQIEHSSPAVQGLVKRINEYAQMIIDTNDIDEVLMCCDNLTALGLVIKEEVNDNDDR